MPKVVIDAGHGGIDSGAVGFGDKEKDWTLRVSLYQYKRFKELGIDAVLTRDSDKTFELNERCAWIKKQNANFCISNHFNSNVDGKARGVETIHSIYADGKLANRILNEIVKASGLPKRRAYTRKNKIGKDYYAIHRLTGRTESVIVEYGFINNKEDHAYLKNHLETVAEAVVKAFCEHIKHPYKPPTSNQPTKTEGIYKVQIFTGSKEGALKVLQQAKMRGFVDAFIVKG